MSYQNYTVEDFAADEKFIQWVKSNDPQLDAFWTDWIADHPEQRQTMLEARALLLNLNFEQDRLSPDEKAELWRRVETGMSAPMVAKVVGWRSLPRWTRMAAVLLLLVMGAWLSWEWLRSTEQVLRTSYGEQRELVLEDGTQVILNANSVLRYDEREPRRVSLEGEAYFEVAKKPATGADFLVETKDLKVRVLGTVFNVNSRREATKVFLAEGKVNLELPEAQVDTVAMAPGDLVSYSRKDRHLSEKRKASALENTSWKDGTLMFRDAPLAQVLRDLSEIHGVTFQVEETSLHQKRITGGVPIKNLRIALETLKGIYQVRIEAQEDSTVFSIQP